MQNMPNLIFVVLLCDMLVAYGPLSLINHHQNAPPPQPQTAYPFRRTWARADATELYGIWILFSKHHRDKRTRSSDNNHKNSATLTSSFPDPSPDYCWEGVISSERCHTCDFVAQIYRAAKLQQSCSTTNHGNPCNFGVKWRTDVTSWLA